MHISVQHITKTYKTGKKALGNVSIDIESPALIGLVGPNGAGKSTLMKLLDKKIPVIWKLKFSYAIN